MCPVAFLSQQRGESIRGTWTTNRLPNFVPRIMSLIPKWRWKEIFSDWEMWVNSTQHVSGIFKRSLPEQWCSWKRDKNDNRIVSSLKLSDSSQGGHTPGSFKVPTRTFGGQRWCSYPHIYGFGSYIWLTCVAMRKASAHCLARSRS